MTAVVVSTDCLGCGHGELAHADRALAPQCSTPGCICLRYRPGGKAASPAASSTAQAICRCRHGARLHERDASSPYDRGICMQRSCDCSRYAPADAVHVDVPARPEPGDDVPVESVQPVERPSSPVAKSEVPPPALVVRPKTEAMLPCPAAGCADEFETGQALADHRATAHPAPVIDAVRPGPRRLCGAASPDGVSRCRRFADHTEERRTWSKTSSSYWNDTETRADADSPSPEPDQPENGPREVTAASAGQLPAAPHSGRDTESRGDPHRDTQPETADNTADSLADAAEPADVAPTEPADPTRIIRSLTAHIEYFDADLALSSTLDLNLANVGPIELQAITSMVLRYLTGDSDES